MARFNSRLIVILISVIQYMIQMEEDRQTFLSMLLALAGMEAERRSVHTRLSNLPRERRVGRKRARKDHFVQFPVFGPQQGMPLGNVAVQSPAELSAEVCPLGNKRAKRDLIAGKFQEKLVDFMDENKKSAAELLSLMKIMTGVLLVALRDDRKSDLEASFFTEAQNAIFSTPAVLATPARVVPTVSPTVEVQTATTPAEVESSRIDLDDGFGATYFEESPISTPADNEKDGDFWLRL